MLHVHDRRRTRGRIQSPSARDMYEYDYDKSPVYIPATTRRQPFSHSGSRRSMSMCIPSASNFSIQVVTVAARSSAVRPRLREPVSPFAVSDLHSQARSRDVQGSDSLVVRERLVDPDHHLAKDDNRPACEARQVAVSADAVEQLACLRHAASPGHHLSGRRVPEHLLDV